jgi:lysozyme
MARKGRGPQARIAAAILLFALVGGVWGWWSWRYWLPDRAEFPVQGVEIGAQDGAVDWRALKATGAQFAYLDASAGAFARDPAFSRNLKEARAAGVKTGAVHLYDPCQPGDRQAANFVVVVPRGEAMLPPAVELDRTADECPVATSDAEVESELMTFLNQIETHTGQHTLLKLGAGFERRYRMAARIERNLWLVRDLFQPDYAGRPWTLWTASSRFANDHAAGPLRWVVVQP